MGWKFWQKNTRTESVGHAPKVKLPKPKELPEHMGMYLVVKEKMDPDWVWSLKCAKRLRENDKSLFDFRIFSESDAAEAGVNVSNYDVLDNHINLILFHGYSDKHGYDFHIEKDATEKAA